MLVFNISQAKTHLAKLIKLAEQGEEVFLARRTQVVARVLPIKRKPTRRKLDILRGKFKVSRKFFEPLPNSELDVWSS